MTIAPVSTEHLLAVAETMPAAPQILARLNVLLQDLNSGLDDVAGLLARDPALTGRIIRIANSPVYSKGGIRTIDEAVQRVGFGEVYRLVGVAANICISEFTLHSYGYSLEALRPHNLFKALVAEATARRMGLETRAAYTVGLLRSIGKILLDRVGRDRLTTREERYPYANEPRVSKWEERVFGINHFAVASLLLEKWNFPEDIVQAVGFDASTGPSPNHLCSAMSFTESLVQSAGLGLEGDDVTWGNPRDLLDAIGLSVDDAGEIKEECRIMLNALQSLR